MTTGNHPVARGSRTPGRTKVGFPTRLDRPGLDAEQMEAVRAPRGPVVILAGAGTGKTRTITHRIAHLIDQGQVNPLQVLAVTFTSRAAGELRSRLRELGVGKVGGRGIHAATFHAAALRQLRYFWPQFMGTAPWQLAKNRFPFVARAAELTGAGTDRDSLRDLLGEIEWAKATLHDHNDYAEAVMARDRDSPLAPEVVAKVMEKYEELKRTADGFYLDFDDLLVYTSAALMEFPSIAEEFRSHYRSFVVDEFQDVTPLQQQLLDGWCGNRDDLTVVGDVNQTIYSFTGADPRFLLNFPRRFPDATVVRLVRDYRSTPQVVGLANRVIGAAKGDAAKARVELKGMRDSGIEPRVTRYEDEGAEAHGVVEAIKRLILEGTPPEEIAILYRINAQSASFEQELTEAGIPYQVRGGEGFFDRSEVRQALTSLSRFSHRDDLPEEGTGSNLPTIVRAILSDIGLTATEPEGARARERWESLSALVRLTQDLVRVEPHLDLTGLVRELQVRAQAKQPPTVKGVTLASLHAAKGLEWDAVFLVGLAEGTLPIRYVLGERSSVDSIEEERRLLYVGITRARLAVDMSWAAARNEGGRARRRCRFLDDAFPLSGAQRRSLSKNDNSDSKKLSRADRKEAAEARFASFSQGQRKLYEDLVAWRRERSRTLSKPAFVIFTDATLLDIVCLEPLSQAELVQAKGVGAAKLEAFGEDILTIVRRHAA